MFFDEAIRAVIAPKPKNKPEKKGGCLIS